MEWKEFWCGKAGRAWAFDGARVEAVRAGGMGGSKRDGSRGGAIREGRTNKRVYFLEAVAVKSIDLRSNNPSLKSRSVSNLPFNVDAIAP